METLMFRSRPRFIVLTICAVVTAAASRIGIVDRKGSILVIVRS